MMTAVKAEWLHSRSGAHAWRLLNRRNGEVLGTVEAEDEGAALAQLSTKLRPSGRWKFASDVEAASALLELEGEGRSFPILQLGSD